MPYVIAADPTSHTVNRASARHPGPFRWVFPVIVALVLRSLVLANRTFSTVLALGILGG
jgi:hypothetical protein